MGSHWPPPEELQRAQPTSSPNHPFENFKNSFKLENITPSALLSFLLIPLVAFKHFPKGLGKNRLLECLKTKFTRNGMKFSAAWTCLGIHDFYNLQLDPSRVTSVKQQPTEVPEKSSPLQTQPGKPTGENRSTPVTQEVPHKAAEINMPNNEPTAPLILQPVPEEIIKAPPASPAQEEFPPQEAVAAKNKKLSFLGKVFSYFPVL